MSTSGTVSLASPTADPATRRVDQLRDAAGQIVGSTFYGTLLRIQRESNLKGPYGHGGRGEEVFRAQLDQILAEQAGRARAFDLTDSIVARYEKRVRAMALAAAARGGEA
jgi:hypothetical protein